MVNFLKSTMENCCKKVTSDRNGKPVQNKKSVRGTTNIQWYGVDGKIVNGPSQKSQLLSQKGELCRDVHEQDVTIDKKLTNCFFGVHHSLNNVFCSICGEIFNTKYYSSLRAKIMKPDDHKNLNGTVEKTKPILAKSMSNKIVAGIIPCHTERTHQPVIPRVYHKNLHKIFEIRRTYVTKNISRDLQSHLSRSNQDLKPALCEFCGEQFRSERELKHHIEKRHELLHSKPLVTCDYCGKQYSSKATLKDHICICHTEKKRFSCKLCDKKYCYRHSLRTHVQFVHEGKPKISCIACDLKFISRGKLNRHVADVHQNARTFSCGICQKTFKRKDTLTTHVKYVHRDLKIVTCDYCKQIFSDKKNLSLHINNNHNSQEENSKLQ